MSRRPEDHPGDDFAAAVGTKRRTDSIFVHKSPGLMEFQRIRYRSSADGLEIPAYVFAPLQKRGPRGHAAMIWVHGGVHGDWNEVMWPFIREAIQRGYVIICPEYRGSVGYGRAFYDAVDYGGLELDDVRSAVDYLKRLPYIDPERLGIMGWSHGGFISAHLLFREREIFRAGAAIVPVTNLVFRLSLKGPAYQRLFATQRSILGLPFEKKDEYLARSPVYRVDSLSVPMLVHVTTNDGDVEFVEAEQLINALRAKKPGLAETRVYVDAPGGHGFDRQVNRTTLERIDTPEQRDSWNRVWAFFEWWLRPYETGPGK